MAFTLTEQVAHQLNLAQTILIVLPQGPSIDAFSSAQLLGSFLLDQQKQVTIVSHDFKKPQQLAFAHEALVVEPTISHLEKTLIKIDKTQFPKPSVFYQEDEKMLAIHLKSDGKKIPKEAIQITESGFKPDLIICINTLDLASLGETYLNHHQLFFQTTIINIDHRPDNEQYGQINWVNVNKSSSTEMIYEFVSQQANFTLNKDLASIVLAGMMQETHTFRTTNVSPATMKIVSELVNNGAEHQLIVDHLYRSKTVGMLKLWGEALHSIQFDPLIGLAWCSISAQSFTKTQTTADDLNGLMDEIIGHTPQAKTIVLFIEFTDKQLVEVRLSTTPPLHAKDLVKEWQPAGSERMVTAHIFHKPLEQAQTMVIEAIRKRLSGNR